MKTTSPTSQLTHLGNFFAKRFAPVALFVMAILTMITGNDSALLSAYPWLILAWPTGMRSFSPVSGCVPFSTITPSWKPSPASTSAISAVERSPLLIVQRQ